MKPETLQAMPWQPDRSGIRDAVPVLFGAMRPGPGQIEWLIDRIEGRS